MSADPFSDAIRAAVRAEVEPLRAQIDRLRGEVASLVSALPPSLVTVPEAARRLGLSTATVRRRIKDRSLPVVRVGHSVRVDLALVRPPEEATIERLALEALHQGG